MTTISEEEQARRREAWRQANASIRIEGGTISPEFKALQERHIAGEISRGKLREELTKMERKGPVNRRGRGETSFEGHAAEKSASREKDRADLEAGRITAAELARKNGPFHGTKYIGPSSRIQALATSIISDPEVRGGMPVIRGTRCGAHEIADLASVETLDCILADYPSLTRELVMAAVEYAREHPRRGDVWSFSRIASPVAVRIVDVSSLKDRDD